MPTFLGLKYCTPGCYNLSMIIILDKKITQEELKTVSEDLDGYIKFVVDLEKDNLAAGGKWHVEAEQVLLKNGSIQENLWGGGLDLETGGLDFDSMINIRPAQGNSSREVLSPEIRSQMQRIVEKLLK